MVDRGKSFRPLGVVEALATAGGVGTGDGVSAVDPPDAELLLLILRLLFSRWKNENGDDALRNPGDVGLSSVLVEALPASSISSDDMVGA